MLGPDDLAQLEMHGLSQADVEAQLANFRNGFPPSRLVAPAVVGDGIERFTDAEVDRLVRLYEETQCEMVKFVPASGAASRMFKKLFSFMEEYDGSQAGYDALTADTSSGSMYQFLKRLEAFAFYEDLKQTFDNGGLGLPEAHLKRDYVSILKCLLTEEGLAYGALPKGLLKFHKYDGSTRTPVEEHIVEGCQYARSGDGKVRIHFTVSPEHLGKFHQHVAEVGRQYESQYGVTLEISYSMQQPSTDTIAVDLENNPFRNQDGSLLLRPAGHGALLTNLNDIDRDIIFLKNIDNVVPDRIKEETIRYKKAIGGHLIELQRKTFKYLEELESEVSDEKLDEIRTFVTNSLGYRHPHTMDKSVLRKILERPIRVCGMVRNEGETGGGPFWITGSDGSTTLQVVETAQLDLDDAKQKEIFQASTHFNPVDVVCGVRDRHGKKYDLMQFRDPATGFITRKSKDGKDLKAQELPGLWNGSMAHWNTAFVEVPLITFNPVKSVTDLLKEQHQ